MGRYNYRVVINLGYDGAHRSFALAGVYKGSVPVQQTEWSTIVEVDSSGNITTYGDTYFQFDSNSTTHDLVAFKAVPEGQSIRSAKQYGTDSQWQSVEKTSLQAIQGSEGRTIEVQDSFDGKTYEFAFVWKDKGSGHTTEVDPTLRNKGGPGDPPLGRGWRARVGGWLRSLLRLGN